MGNWVEADSFDLISPSFPDKISKFVTWVYAFPLLNYFLLCFSLNSRTICT